MSIDIKTELLFHVTDKSDLHIALKIGHDDIAAQSLKLEDVLKESLRYLSPSEKRREKAKIAQRIRYFLKELEK